MASPWTIPKLVTWRVKDWASCFLACRFPLDDGDGANNNNNDNNYTFKKNKRKMKSNRRERKLSLSPPPTRQLQHLRKKSTRSSSVSPAQHRRQSWPPPPLPDDGFIVFCFDRDGGFDVLKEDSQRDDRSPAEKSPKMVHRKLTYGDQEAKTEEKNSSENETEQDRTNNTCTYPGDEDVSSDVRGKVQEEEGEEEEEAEEINASGGSSGSNNSDKGRGSFAFPILGVEWMGSPVQMPKSDGLCLKKQKANALRFQCCRF